MADQNVNPDGTPYTGALVVLVPAADDPIVAASSEPAHLTTIWFGEMADLSVDVDELEQAVRLYAQDLDGPVTVPVKERGVLGEDAADVAFLEPTDALLALRDGLLVNEPIKTAHDAAEQFPQWTPHVTLGYPETPADGEYDADSVTFDRVGLWLGGDNIDYPMGGTVSDTITADAAGDITDVPMEDDGSVIDEPEDDEELINEIPIHGVLAVEGVETGDARGFRPGALSTRTLPIPYRYEAVGSHGGNGTSEVYDVGRIEEAWMDGNLMRFRGVIVLDLPYASEAISTIVSGVKTGISIDADAMSDDVETYTQEYVDEAAAQGKNPTRWFKTTRVSGATQIPIGAFAETYVDLGRDDPEGQAAVDALTACGCLGGDVDDDNPDIELSNNAYRDISTEDRKRMADEGTALPDGSFPIANVDDLKNAIQAIGRAKDPSAVKAHIKKRARALGHPELIPENWASAMERFALDVLSGTVQRGGMQWGKFAPGTHDGPGWITHPIPTARIRRYWTKGEGAAKIRWGQGGDFNRCRSQLAKYVANPEWLAGLCANMHKEALGIWPATHAKADRLALIAAGGVPAPIVTLRGEAEKSQPYPAEWFADPKFTGVTPMHIDKETGRIWGHLAQWASCHMGISGVCQKPPRSSSHYANFLHGVVDTDQGEQPVGTLTYGIGHANPALRASAATAHYDQTDAVFAFVNIGEDAHGIWYSGIIRPGAPEGMIDDVRAIGSLSGDWRRFPRFGLDLVAAVSVNTPGYSLAASAAPAWEGGGDLQMSAIGLGFVDPEDEHGGETHEQFVSRIADQVAAKFRRDERQRLLAGKVFALRMGDARRRIEEMS